MNPAQSDIIKLLLHGDWEADRFLIHSVQIVRGAKRFEIFLTSEQTNMAVHYDDSFCPCHGIDEYSRGFGTSFSIGNFHRER